MKLGPRALLFPLVVTAMVAYALATPSLDLAGALGLPEAANPGLRPASAILLFYALIAVLERLFPHRPEWNRSHGDVRTDVFHLLFTGAASQALVAAVVLGPLSLLSIWVSGAAGGALWPDQWPMLAQLALALVLGELGHYLFHRISHENPWVWRLHAAHHSAPRLYWLNATRFHVLDLSLIISCESLPLALLGAGAEVLGPYFVLRAVYGQLQHCNVDMPTPRWIDWLWSSPNVHRWHHSTVSRRRQPQLRRRAERMGPRLPELLPARRALRGPGRHRPAPELPGRLLRAAALAVPLAQDPPRERRERSARRLTRLLEVAHPAALIVGDRLADLLGAVHHEGTLTDDGLADRLAAEEERGRVLGAVDADALAGAIEERRPPRRGSARSRSTRRVPRSTTSAVV